MFRLILALFAFLWSVVLQTDSGGSAEESNDGETFKLSSEELTRRTTAAGEAERKRIAEMFGVDPGELEDVKTELEKFRGKAGSSGAPPGEQTGNEEEDTAIEQLFDFLAEQTERMEKLESAEAQRAQHATEQQKSAMLSSVLKDAGVRKDRAEAVARYAGSYDLSVNDKGELLGAKDAIDSAKKAFPEAFRGEGDDGRSADAGGQRDGRQRPQDLRQALAAHYQKQGG